MLLCRHCGNLSQFKPTCDCRASIPVKKCTPDKTHADQLKKCEACDYQRGSIGDPVQEIIHGSDGPSAVITTALHGLLPQGRRKVLAFADSRQDAAFFAWYAEDSYRTLRDRNLILRALKSDVANSKGLSIKDLKGRLMKKLNEAKLFQESDTDESRDAQVLTSIFKEVLTEEKRISLSGVGLIKWFVKSPTNLELPKAMQKHPWNLTRGESHNLLGYLLDQFRLRRAISLPEDIGAPLWKDVCSRPQWAYCRGDRNKRSNVSEWGYRNSAAVNHFLRRVIAGSDHGHHLSGDEKREASVNLMKDVWQKLQDSNQRHQGHDKILLPGKSRWSISAQSKLVTNQDY